MKKTFPLHQPKHADARVVEAIKLEVRKYVKRERRKKFPAGFTQWDFACKVGSDALTAETTSIDNVIPAIDTVAKSASPQVYIEIIASAANRTAPVEETPPDTAVI